MTPRSILKRAMWLAVQVPTLRPAVVAYYDRHANSHEHPYDRAHGVHTSGMVPGFVLRPGEPIDTPKIARRNAAVMAKAHPDRTRINVVTADAVEYRLPDGPLVVFLYNAFGQPLIGRLLHNSDASLRATLAVPA